MPKAKTPVVVYAREQWLDTPSLASDSNISLHVYRTPDHTLSEMMNEWYFTTIMHRLRPGDFIRIRDGENNHSEIIVDEILKEQRRVLLSIYHVLNVVPVEDAMAGDRCTVRWRGKRLFGIMRGADVIVQDIRSRDEAEQMLRFMRRSGNYSKEGARNAEIEDERRRMTPQPRRAGRDFDPTQEFDAWENKVTEAPALRASKDSEAEEESAA